MGVVDRRKPEEVPYSFGVPRYMLGRAVRAAGDTVQRVFSGREPDRAFTNELAWWDLAGFVYGKHWYRSADMVEITSPRRDPTADNPPRGTDTRIPCP
jgi:hypothetical protein